MGKDSACSGVQQMKIAQFSASGAGSGPLAEDSERLQEPQGATVAQILMAIKTLSTPVQVKIEAIALDGNSLRTDVCNMAEISVETKQQVSKLQEEMAMLRATVDKLETWSHKLEKPIADAEG
ncbi:hypothetical protein NDU88_004969 [Pleurodeles waltl]|uniref:Uncharacterized protein n=1 Tax=Pleurodeles waltl TaxID=8319 RepID=A0AAV7QJF2_PLEWA|nr:hypothetical protein NDU88_004969 [Pleurodeles waltl]